MRRDDGEIWGKILSRDVYVERVLDPDGNEAHVMSATTETVENWDGTNEKSHAREVVTVGCGHPHRMGEFLARCELCSKKARRASFVCPKCAVQCPECGASLCVAHTRPTPDDLRYCRTCFRKGYRRAMEKLGRDKQPGILRRVAESLLEWW